MIKQITLLILLSGTSIVKSYSQDKNIPQKNEYLSFQTGFIYDGNNSLGVRTFFEYQKEWNIKWLYGISYEHSRHLVYITSDNGYNDKPTNLSLLSGNIYYKINASSDKIFWTAGMGLGVAHVYWEGRDKIGGTINLSMTLDIKIAKKIYLETSPIIIFPPNRFYLSTIKMETYNHFFAFTLFPIGLKFKL